MRTLIANFKMNLTPSETKDYLMAFLSRFDGSKIDLTLCLPYTSLGIGTLLCRDKNVRLGAQNLSDEEQGKNTGEISGAMLKDSGVDYVIIGHSERRKKFKEDTKTINKKIKVALKNGLGVILCVGESLTERNTLKTFEVLREQIECALKGLYENELERIIIAYEPIWAIGSGKTPTKNEIEGAVKEIRHIIKDDFSENASISIKVVYGGSIDSKNIKQFLSAKKLDGFLVGGACLDPNEFLKITSLCS